MNSFEPYPLIARVRELVDGQLKPRREYLGAVVGYKKYSREYFDKLYVQSLDKVIDVNPVDVELFTGIRTPTGQPIFEGDIVETVQLMDNGDDVWGCCEICLPLDLTAKGKRKRLLSYCYEPTNETVLYNWEYLPWKLMGQSEYLQFFKGKDIEVLEKSRVFKDCLFAGTFHRRQWIERHLNMLQQQELNF